ncbi:hypothetical protein Tco_0336523 [Tanacetum coccineum]
MGNIQAMERRIDQIVTELEELHNDPNSQKPISESTLHALQKVIDELSSKNLSISSSLIPSLTSALQWNLNRPSGPPSSKKKKGRGGRGRTRVRVSKFPDSLFEGHCSHPDRDSTEILMCLSSSIIMSKSQARIFGLAFVVLRSRAELRALAVKSILEIVKALEHKDQIDFVDYVVNKTQGREAPT